MLDKLLRKVRREPVRVRLYAIVAAALGVLVYHGVLQLDAVPVYLALAGAVLVVERTRAQVVPAIKGRRRKRTRTATR